MDVFLTAFGLHNPCVGPRLQSHSGIPISVDCPNGLDLDYSALLVANSFVIDRTAYSRVIEEKRPHFLAPLARSLSVLEQEGLLKICDYGKICNQYRTEIEAKTATILEAPIPWLRIVRRQWSRVKPEFEEFARRYSDPSMAQYDKLHYGIASYLERRDGSINDAEYTRLNQLMESRRSRLTAGELEDVREILKPLIAEIVINDLLRQTLKMPFLDWEDAEEYHERLYAWQWNEIDESVDMSSRPAKEARRLFTIVLPELLPCRIEDVVRFLRKRKAVESLRRQLWDIMESGGAVSNEWMLQIQTEAAQAGIRAESRARVVKWIGRIAGWAIPGGEAIVDSAKAAGELIVDGVEGLARKRVTADLNWYHLLQRIKYDADRESDSHSSSKRTEP